MIKNLTFVFLLIPLLTCAAERQDKISLETALWRAIDAENKDNVAVIIEEGPDINVSKWQSFVQRIHTEQPTQKTKEIYELLQRYISNSVWYAVQDGNVRYVEQVLQVRPPIFLDQARWQEFDKSVTIIQAADGIDSVLQDTKENLEKQLRITHLNETEKQRRAQEISTDDRLSEKMQKIAQDYLEAVEKIKQKEFLNNIARLHPLLKRHMDLLLKQD